MTNHIKNSLVGSLLVVLALAGGCEKQPQPASSSNASDTSTDQESLQVKIDKHGDEIMASSTKAEARQWLQQPKHLFFKGDPKVVSQFVEQFYSAGAQQVFISGIEEHDGNQYAGGLLIVMPADLNSRAMIFQVSRRADAAFNEVEASDQGQKYLYYSFD